MRLIQMAVAPVNCQVAFVVPDSEEGPPEWSTGREQVVANSGAIYVATICDVDGEVAIEVWRGEELPHQHPKAIYDGTLQVRDAGALVGSVTGNHLGLLPMLHEGEHRVRVYVEPPGALADHVYFVID